MLLNLFGGRGSKMDSFGLGLIPVISFERRVKSPPALSTGESLRLPLGLMTSAMEG